MLGRRTPKCRFRVQLTVAGWLPGQASSAKFDDSRSWDDPTTEGLGLPGGGDSGEGFGGLLLLVEVIRIQKPCSAQPRTTLDHALPSAQRRAPAHAMMRA